MTARFPLILAGVSALAIPLRAQVAFDGDYTQNFDTLATTGSGATANTWTDNATLAGWYVSRTTYSAGTGSSNAGSIYSFGAATGGTQTERALGSVGSGTTGNVGYGVRLQNTAGVTLESINISFRGEQWRNGGNATQQSLSFWFQVGTSLTDTTPGSNVGWTSVASLNFLGPVATITAAAVDGNAVANRVSLSAELPGVSLAPGQELFLRWLDLNDAGNDHGLAIDDLNVTALTVVPEPSTWALLGGGLIFLAHRLRRRK